MQELPRKVDFILSGPIDHLQNLVKLFSQAQHQHIAIVVRDFDVGDHGHSWPLVLANLRRSGRLPNVHVCCFLRCGCE